MTQSIYLSGPMSGFPEHNFPAFNAEAKRLRALGYEVVNPAELNPGDEGDWNACMRTDITALMACDTLALMAGWEGSNGAHLEVHIAHRVGMDIVLVRDLVCDDIGKLSDVGIDDSVIEEIVLALQGLVGEHQPLGIDRPAYRRALAALEAVDANVVRDSFDLITHLHRQRDFSFNTFGPGARTAGVLDHIRKELVEIEKDPRDVTEWIDVVMLALDGAWRAGHTPEAIAKALQAKQEKNERRTWPDWRTAEPGTAIEHVREVSA